MIKWTKKTYAKELKKGYWELEPHFYYYGLLELFSLFKTFIEANMTPDDFQSAMYGKFICEGKPIKKGFYNNFNFTSSIVKLIQKRK